MTAPTLITGPGASTGSPRPVRTSRPAKVPDLVQVHGGHPLSGHVQLDGFKHAFVTVAAASLMGRHRVTVQGAPAQAESGTLLRLLASAGLGVSRTGSEVRIDASGGPSSDVDAELFDTIHGGLYLVPGLLAQRGTASFCAAGGCAIGDGPSGARPIRHYIELIERFGGEAELGNDGKVHARARRLRGCDIDLTDFTENRSLLSGPLYSGATKFAILCAAAADRPCLIRHPYPKADVLELLQVLDEMGASVERCAGDAVRVGPGQLWTGTRDITHTLIADLIQAVTWICADIATGGRIDIQAADPARLLRALEPELEVLSHMGVVVDTTPAGLRARRTGGRLRPAHVTVASRSVYSDAQPFLALLMTGAEGTSTLREEVWRNRFSYADELATLGCAVSRQPGALLIDGPHRPHLRGRQVEASDLRSAAMLLIAALCVNGVTDVGGLHHLARGYCDFVGQLTTLGAVIDA